MAVNEGRRRLQLLLSASSGGLCLLLMLAVLAIYGTPYNHKWWLAMAVILALAVGLPRLLARPVEWVMEGYGLGAGTTGDRQRRAA